MADSALVEPDAKFVRDVINGGGRDLKKCFQCATCTSVCSLSDEDHSFPRKQVPEAQWGLRDKLVADPAVWLCHDCGDCSVRCPRNAQPSRIMGAIRQQVIRRCAFPAFMGTLVSESLALRMLIAIPAVILTLIAALPLPRNLAHPLVFSELFPRARLEPLFFGLAALVVVAYVVAMSRFVRALRSGGANGRILSALGPVLLQILRHERFAKCGTERRRYWGHMLVLLAFVGLAITGTIVGVGTMLGLMETPLSLDNPLKIFANLCAAVALIGISLLIANRFKLATRATTTYFDWFFLLLLGSVFLTGLLSEVLRLRQSEMAMYTIYFIHLTLDLRLIPLRSVLQIRPFPVPDGCDSGNVGKTTSFVGASHLRLGILGRAANHLCALNWTTGRGTFLLTFVLRRYL